MYKFILALILGLTFIFVLILGLMANKCCKKKNTANVELAEEKVTQTNTSSPPAPLGVTISMPEPRNPLANLKHSPRSLAHWQRMTTEGMDPVEAFKEWAQFNIDYNLGLSREILPDPPPGMPVVNNEDYMLMMKQIKNAPNNRFYYAMNQGANYFTLDEKSGLGFLLAEVENNSLFPYQEAHADKTLTALFPVYNVRCTQFRATMDCGFVEDYLNWDNSLIEKIGYMHNLHAINAVVLGNAKCMEDNLCFIEHDNNDIGNVLGRLQPEMADFLFTNCRQTTEGFFICN